jgi:hypothetical protein
MVHDESSIVPGSIPDERSLALTIPPDELFFRGVWGVFFPPQTCPKILGSFEPSPPDFSTEDFVKSGWVMKTDSPCFFRVANFFQLTRDILRPSLTPCHKKLIWIDLKVLWMKLGAAKAENM